MANSQIHLPETVIDQLDPKLAKLCSEMPSELSLRIGELVRQALRVPIHPNRLVKYAFLFASAQLLVERDAHSREHATAARAELAGEFHGLGKESSDGAEAQRRYNRGRRARQQVASSLNSLQMKCQAVEKIAQKYHLDLPVHLQQQLIHKKIAAIRKELLALKNAAAFSCGAEVHCHTMAKKTVILPRPSDTVVPAPIVAEDSRWIIAVGKVRYAVDFHATARRLKQAPAKVVPIRSRLGSL